MTDGRRSRRVWSVNVALLLVIVAVVVGVVVALTSSSSAAPGLRTVPVGRGTVTETVSASGTVSSATSSTVDFPTGGTIASVRVALGDRVRAGQTLATLDGESARASLQAARAQLTASREQLSSAVDTRDAAVAGTPAAADGPVLSARAAVAQAQAQVVAAQQNTDDLTLVAPQNGTVTSLDAKAGRTVGGGGVATTSTGGGSAASAGGGSASGGSASAGAQSGGSAAGGATGSAAGGAGATAAAGGATTPLMTITDLDSLQVVADIPELDVGRIATGQPATISVNALPGDHPAGAVASVDTLPATSSAVQYGTVVDVMDPPRGLRPGMSASVSIVVAQAGDTTFVPSVALTASGGVGARTATAQVLGSDGRVSQRSVGVGLASDAATQVTSGLAAGELVVLPDPSVANSFGPGAGPPNSAQQTRTAGR